MVSPNNNDNNNTTVHGTSINEVPGDWEDLFVTSRVRYIKHLDLTNFQKMQYKCSLHLGIVNN